jgi:DNA-binding NtrC family response regulator
VVLTRGASITRSDLPVHLGELKPEDSGASGSLVERLAEFERALIVEALGQADGVQTRAAKALGISERHLRYRMRKHGL